MADLGKNGYSWSGYTEPFFVPEGVTINDGTPLRNVSTIPIELTEYRNSVLYVRSDMTASGVTTFMSKDINFDTRSDVNKDAWILDVNGVEATVSNVSYDNLTGLYTITTNAMLSVEDGKVYRVIKRNVDVGETSASKTYLSGEKVVELYVDFDPA
jgi:hypothetical protein